MKRNSTGKEMHQSDDIAIVGMACLFPGAPDLTTYWQNIVNKVDAVSDPPEGWEGDAWYDPASTANDRIYTKKGGYLGDLARFDPLRYGVMPSAVDGAEPEHFLALKVASEALADAGDPEIPINRERTDLIIGRGTFINRGYTTLHQHGLFIDQTLRLVQELTPEFPKEKLQELKEKLKSNLPPFTPETAPGLVSSVMSGRVANRLDLRGANYGVDAACASSLIAVELGVQSLLTGKCDVVLAGGVQLATHHLMLMVFTQLGALSRTAQIRPFDEAADGTLLGEGVGFVVLKRRRDAQRDGNRIYALVKAVGSSSDGRGKSVVAPKMEGEELAIRRAYQLAGVSPATVKLVEAHGTAMPLGDLTEIQALGRVFGGRHNGLSGCALGSVKSMIAHLIPAAGMAGLIKTALALHSKLLPPTLHCGTPNPKLELEKTPFYINQDNRPWIHGDLKTPRRAGVNSFGFGGINAHAVLEEFTGQNESESTNLYQQWETELFILQGNTRQELIDQAEKILIYLNGLPPRRLADLAFTLAAPPIVSSHRLAIVAASLEDLRGKLEHALKRLREPKTHRLKDKSGIYYFADPLRSQGSLAFLFPGEGSQYVYMLADLCPHFPEVRSCFDFLDYAYLDSSKGVPPSQIIFPPSRTGEVQPTLEEALWQIDYAVDAVVTADRAMFRLLEHLEIRPDVVLGHSSGEFMALEAAGALAFGSQEELIQTIVAGNRMNEDLHTQGALPETLLVAVGGVKPEIVADLVRKSAGQLIIAMSNCPNQMVICGEPELTHNAVKALKSQGAICQILPFQRPYHTPWYKPATAPMQEFFNNLNIVSPKLTIYSCMTARPMPADPASIRALSVEQWAQPVRFQETIEEMYQAGVRIFVEVGPKANLTAFIGDILKKKPHLAVAANVHHRPGITQLHHALGLLAAHGVTMRLEHLYKRRQPQDLSAELYSDGALLRPQEKPAPILPMALPILSPEGLSEFQTKLPATLGNDGDQLETGRNVTENAVRPAVGPEPVPLATSGGSLPPSMQEYFLTMERFLETQQEIMGAFLSTATKVEKGRRPSQPSDLEEFPRVMEARPTQGIPGGGPRSEVRDRGDQREGVRVAKVAEPIPGQTEQQPGEEGTIWSRTALENWVLSLVSSKTGYPFEMLSLDQDLEADLGIDSIKRVEILGVLREKAGTSVTPETEKITEYKTLRELIEFFLPRPDGEKGNGDATALPRPDLPFIGEILSLSPGQELIARREFDLEEDIFLLDHTFGRRVAVTDPGLTGLPLMPLTVSLEIMAQAATMVIPNQLLVGMKELRAYRWITFEKQKLTLRLEARLRSPGEVQVSLRKEKEPGSTAPVGLPLLEGIMVFAEKYAPAPTAGDFDLKGRRPANLPAEHLYSEGMFMGPTFQGVAALDWWGEDGIEATLRILPFQTFFKSDPNPRFVTDPVLLDGAGQLVAYWVADHREIYNVYPFRVESLHFFSPNPKPGDHITGRARVRQIPDNQLSSDIDIVDSAGNVHLRIIGWDDRSFELPERFYKLRFKPLDTRLSDPCPAPLTAFSEHGPLACCLMEDLPNDLLRAHGKVWQLALAHLALNRREREIWENLPQSDKRRTEWLLARVAGKDAVRQLLEERYGLQLCLPDVEIQADSYGRPQLTGPWASQINGIPALSLAHTRGLAIAMASGDGFDCGIDVERLDPRREGIEKFSLSPEERALVASLLPSLDLEWTLRIWCAKEATGKALGRGLPGGPLDLKVTSLNATKGSVVLEVSGTLAKSMGKRQPRWHVNTVRHGDLIIGSTLAKKGDQNEK